MLTMLKKRKTRVNSSCCQALNCGSHHCSLVLAKYQWPHRLFRLFWQQEIPHFSRCRWQRNWCSWRGFWQWWWRRRQGCTSVVAKLSIVSCTRQVSRPHLFQLFRQQEIGLIISCWAITKQRIQTRKLNLDTFLMMETSQSAQEQKHEGVGEDQGEYEVNLTSNLQDRNSAEGQLAWPSQRDKSRYNSS